VPRDAGLHPCGAPQRVDPQALHAAGGDHHRAGGVADRPVPGGLDGDGQALRPGEGDGHGDVLGAGGADRDGRRVLDGDVPGGHLGGQPGPHGVVDDAMVALLDDLVAEREAAPGRTPEDEKNTARLLGTLGIELAFGSDDRGVQAATRAVGLARRLGDPELLRRTLNNYSVAVWGRPGAAELRLAAADEALVLAGRGLPRRTEFFARLHRAAIRLHLADLAGFEADHAQARRLGISLSGPEVRPHVLWQAAGLAWLRGFAAQAED
jgi:hypothetical protein